MRKTPLNRAITNVAGIEFMFIPKEMLNQYSVSEKPSLKTHAAKQKVPDIIYHKKSIARDDSTTLPFMTDYVYLWSIFLTGIISHFVCIGLGFSGFSQLQDEVNHFAMMAFGIVLVLIRFAISSSFNRPYHRKFAVAYGLFFSITSFVFIRRINLGIFEFRPIIMDYLCMPQIYTDIIVSIAIGVVAYAMSTPMLYELFAFQMIRETPNYISFFGFAKEYYNSVIKILKFFTRLTYNLTPLIPIAIYFLSRLVIQPYSDLLFASIFVLVEVLIAISKLYYVKEKAQILTFSSLKSVVEFNSERTYDCGKNSIETINRSLHMVPVSEVALSIHPMVMLTMASVFASSFVMSGVCQALTKHLPLFLMATCDVALAGYRIFGMFIADQ